MRKKVLITVLVTLITLVIVLVGWKFVFSRTNVDDIDGTIGKMYESLEENNIEEYSSYLWKGGSININRSDAIIKLAVDYMHEKYGDKVSITYKITKKDDFIKKCNEKDKKSVADKYIKDYALEGAKEIYIVKSSYTITGEKYSDSKENTGVMFIILKDGKWYVINDALMTKIAAESFKENKDKFN